MVKKILLINPPVIVVDKIQRYAYADMQPFGLLQISTLLKKKGDDVRLIDFMEGDYYENLNFYKSLSAGVEEKRFVSTFYMGHSFSWLKSKLKKSFVPNEIWITCSMIYNYPLAFEVIKICKSYFPNTKIKLGGAYPTNNPNHAKKSGCDKIFVGRFDEADTCKPDYNLYKKASYALFKLSTGCSNKCSFCVNGLEKMKSFDVDFIIEYLVEIEKKYNINYFANWDPNVLLFKNKLIKFLTKIKGKITTPLKFEMGLQPNLISVELLKLMYESGVKTFTIPFDDCYQCEKPYSIISSTKALYNAKKYNFDFNHCHCTYTIGYPNDELKRIFLTFSVIFKLKGNSMCFPLTVIPNTKDYEKYFSLIKNKDPIKYNGHLWPLISSKKIKYYQSLLYFLNSKNSHMLRKRLKSLPINIQNLFLKEFSKANHFISLCLKHKDTKENLNKILKSLNS